MLEPEDVETERLPARRAAELQASPEPASIERLLAAAIDKGTSVESLEKLVTLYERVADRRAAAEFADALARFQSECPSVPKTSTANVATKSGTKFSYSYAELDEIARVVRPVLHRLGLSYTWNSKLADRVVSCTCFLRHANGHTIEATFEAPIDSSASMNETQKHAAALTYARRQSLVQVLGLTSTDPDTDVKTTEPIDRDEVSRLEALIASSGADREKFLRYMKAGSLEGILKSDYQRAVAALEAKGRSVAR